MIILIFPLRKQPVRTLLNYLTISLILPVIDRKSCEVLIFLICILIISFFSALTYFRRHLIDPSFFANTSSHNSTFFNSQLLAFSIRNSFVYASNELLVAEVKGNKIFSPSSAVTGNIRLLDLYLFFNSYSLHYSSLYHALLRSLKSSSRLYIGHLLFTPIRHPYHSSFLPYLSRIPMPPSLYILLFRITLLLYIAHFKMPLSRFVLFRPFSNLTILKGKSHDFYSKLLTTDCFTSY